MAFRFRIVASHIMSLITNFCGSILSFLVSALSPSGTLFFDGAEISVILSNDILGEGGFSTVYKVTKRSITTKSRKCYALKEILEQNEETERSIRAELASFSRFKHPNIISLLGHKRTTNQFGVPVVYLLLPYMRNGSLRAVLNLIEAGSAPKMSLERVLSDFSSVCKAFSCLHGHKPVSYIHQDVKPENILISDQGVPLLTDFGSVREAVVNIASRSKVRTLPLS
jgi:serine/threonine protein kinase